MGSRYAERTQVSSEASRGEIERTLRRYGASGSSRSCAPRTTGTKCRHYSQVAAVATVEQVTEQATDLRVGYDDLGILVEAVNDYLPDTREADPEGYALLDELSYALEAMRKRIVTPEDCQHRVGPVAGCQGSRCRA